MYTIVYTSMYANKMHTRILIAKLICSGTVSAVLVVAARPSMTPKLVHINLL